MRELERARKCLAQGEAAHGTATGLAKLVEGLGLLDALMAEDDASHAETARNLAATYAARIYEHVRKRLDDPALPEPELEQHFRVVLAFDQVASALPADARALKIGVVRRLIDRYYEGHSVEKKQEALRALQALEEE